MTKKKVEKLGRLFGRPDIERCDLFIDCGFLDWDEYVGHPEILNESSKKGTQMYSSVPSGGHKKCGLPASSGYFDKHFSTIFVDDPYLERWRLAGRPPAHPLKGAWIPSGPAKKHSTPGDNHGTFTKTADLPAFSPLLRPPFKEKAPINFLTNPGKKGSSGYPDICINKYPPHVVRGRVDCYTAPQLLYSKRWGDHKSKIRNGPLKSGFHPQPYFEANPYLEIKRGPTYVQPKKDEREPGTGGGGGIFYPTSPPKKMGNNHDGCFNKFTEWTSEPYKTLRDVEKELSGPRKSKLIFAPEPRLKTYYTGSVVNNKIDVSCNEKTWRTMKPITYPQFNL